MGEDLFKDYVPEIMEYDVKMDGGFEHKIREDHLNVKERLLQKITKAKNKAKKKIQGGKSLFRQPIRTENGE